MKKKFKCWNCGTVVELEVPINDDKAQCPKCYTIVEERFEVKE